MYVLTTIPNDNLPKALTMFDLPIDEIDKCPTLKQKMEKARECKPASHMRTTVWLWKPVDIATEPHQQKINQHLAWKATGPASQHPVPEGGDNPHGAPAPTLHDDVPATPAPKEEKDKKKKSTQKPDVNAAPVSKGKGKG